MKNIGNKFVFTSKYLIGKDEKRVEYIFTAPNAEYTCEGSLSRPSSPISPLVKRIGRVLSFFLKSGRSFLNQYAFSQQDTKSSQPEQNSKHYPLDTSNTDHPK